MTKPNIHKHTAAICEKLGLEANFVRALHITPRSVEAEVLLKNEDGAKYVDVETGQAAVETRVFEVTA